MPTGICPRCGEKVMVNGLGRKRLGIAVENVYNALRETLGTDRQPRYKDAAEFLSKELGQPVNRGYIHSLIDREAKEQGLCRLDLLRNILKGGDV